jgi:hypothetical protein
MGGSKVDKVRIFGVFEFVSFHLCKRCLESGLCVEGIHFSAERNLLLDEKRLEIGRNANFEEKIFSEIQSAKSDQEVQIISLYDWYMNDHESKFSYEQQIIKSIEGNEGKSQLVLVLPIQLLTDFRDHAGMEVISKFINQIKGMCECVQSFYLPTIFGPWQPSSFLFQREMESNFQPITEDFELREWPYDAIYVDDVLNPMIETIESGKAGSFLLESGIPNSWQQCAKFLNSAGEYRRELDYVQVNSDDDLHKLTLQEVTPFEKALSIQKEHFAYVFGSDDNS